VHLPRPSAPTTPERTQVTIGLRERRSVCRRCVERSRVVIAEAGVIQRTVSRSRGALGRRPGKYAPTSFGIHRPRRATSLVCTDSPDASHPRSTLRWYYGDGGGSVSADDPARPTGERSPDRSRATLEPDDRSLGTFRAAVAACVIREVRPPCAIMLAFSPARSRSRHDEENICLLRELGGLRELRGFTALLRNRRSGQISDALTVRVGRYTGPSILHDAVHPVYSPGRRCPTPPESAVRQAELQTRSSL